MTGYVMVWLVYISTEFGILTVEFIFVFDEILTVVVFG